MPRRASTPRRLLAGWVDYYFVVGVLTAASKLRARSVPMWMVERAAVIALCISVVTLVLDSVLLSARGQTVGAWLFDIRVVTEENERPSALRAVASRLILPFAAMLGASFVPFGLPVLFIANFAPLFHRRQRSLLDLLTRTRVVTAAKPARSAPVPVK